MLQLFVLLFLASSALATKYYRYKFTIDVRTYYGIAFEIESEGPIPSLWIQVLTVQEIEKTEGSELDLTTPTLVNNYRENGRKQFLLNAAISETTEKDEKFEKEKVVWTDICVLQIESLVDLTTLKISYELYETYNYKLTLDKTTYYGTANNFSGESKSRWIQISSVELVSDGNGSALRSLKELKETFQSMTEKCLFFGVIKKEEIEQHLDDPMLVWIAMRLITNGANGENLTLSFEARKFLYYKFLLHGEIYYGSAEDISTREGHKLLEIKNVEEIHNAVDKTPVLTTENLCQRYNEGKKVNPIDVGIIDDVSPWKDLDKSKVLWKPIRLFMVDRLTKLNSNTLSLSYELYKYCHYQVTVNGIVYYGEADLIDNAGISQSLKITKVLGTNKAENKPTLEEFTLFLGTTELQQISEAAITPLAITNYPLEPAKNKWSLINLDRIQVDQQNAALMLSYSPKPVQSFRCNVYLRNSEGTLSATSFFASLWQKSHEIFSEKAPEDYTGLFVLVLDDASGKPFLTDKLPKSTPISIELNGSWWLLESKRQLFGLREVTIKDPQIKGFILKTTYKSIHPEVVPKRFFGHVYCEKDEMGESLEIGVTELEHKLHMGPSGPRVPGQNDEGIIVDDPDKLPALLENSALGFDSQGLLEIEEINWTYICIKSLLLNQDRSTATVSYIVPPERKVQMLIIPDAAGPVEGRSDQKIWNVIIRKYLTASDPETNVGVFSNWTGDVILEWSTDVDTNTRQLNVIGEKAPAVLFLRSSKQCPWRRFIGKNKFIGAGWKLIGSVVNAEPIFWIAPVGQEHKILLPGLKIDEVNRQIVIGEIVNSYEYVNRIATRKETNWIECLAGWDQHKFGIHRGIIGSLLDTDGWVNIGIKDIVFPAKKKKSKDETQQTTIIYNYN